MNQQPQKRAPTFRRQELYRQAWTTPVQRMAPRPGQSE